ncbi:uncharacterized protein GGS22DRAFT_157521 [Annulohypoxylon maeteangense]|uniref:uncharacterized protein n=1 Tax=Annulohypoxylon maeteangense TaxID=1927788 RepID=UPI0020074E6B|nr:uncharacterized protein GGS22DRAFT_157521 [Annulohypoxylon maeteangense]KAI0887581.1 hypothetical protein GGS22DRAFT_157521 [Annulohypoxylon maeteangense]
MSSISLPQEIFLLLCQELAARRDFGTLFNCSLVSKRVAPIALEQLYSIQELSSISIGDDYNRLEWSRLWRSIILSSIGKTAYPYCVYVRSLSIGNLEDCLSDIPRDTHVRSFFFEGPMEQFHLVRDGRLSIMSILIMCADSIIKCIKRSADSAGAAVALEHLEGTYIPHDVLPGWIAQLRGLRSLRIRDGSVLGLDAATAISQHCPDFTDLTCYYYSSPDADTDLAAFFLALRPNSLRSFEIISKNEIGPAALTALNTHSKSLRSLSFRSISAQAKAALPHLSSCTALETLVIENRDFFNYQDSDDAESKEVLQRIIAWISNCKSLKDLNLRIKDALSIAKGVLLSPDIRFTSLSMVDVGPTSEAMEGVDWTALGSQDRLESLTLGSGDTGAISFIQSEFRLAESICNLKNLTSLNLMLTYITSDVLERIATSLPKLSEFIFSGDSMTDSMLQPLGNIPQLKLLSINTFTSFSFEGLYEFAMKLNRPNCMGIRVDILNQIGELKLKESDYARLQQYFAETLQGRIEIAYYHDPDELHEMDFSDTD